MRTAKGIASLTLATAICWGSASHATIIDNDVSAGTLGHFEVDVWDAGETRTVNITADAALSGLITTEIVFDYFSYVNTGGAGFQLVGSAPVLSADDTVTSGGSFVGSAGNTIDWTVTSSIPNLGDTMTSIFTFSTSTGSLGTINFFQYLDEDVLGVGDDVFFALGSLAGGDLELFTVDDDELIGLNHGGAYSAAQGLVNASFEGWAACTYNTQKPDLSAGTQTVSLTGDICAGLSGLAYVHPTLGYTVYGPRDIVSTMGWSVDPNSSSATIITTLGGVPSVEDIGNGNGHEIPEPATGSLMLMGLGALGLFRRRQQQKA